jgi:predicted porin
MQKKLIALAIAGLSSTAFAQSNVTIYGIVDVGVANYSGVSNGTDGSNVARTNGTAGTGSTTQVVSGGAYNSRLGFRGEEALGSGMKASWVYELNLLADGNGASQQAGTTGLDTAGSRQVFLALDTSFGKISGGKMYTPFFNTVAAVDPFGATGIANAGVIHPIVNQTARSSSSLRYDSPNWNGFSFAYQYGMSENYDKIATTTGGHTTSWNALYGNGPLLLGVTQIHLADVSVTTSAIAAGAAVLGVGLTSTALGGTYDFGVVKLHAANNRFKTTGLAANNLDHNDWLLALSKVMGPHTFKVTYNRADDKSVTNMDANHWGLGYEYGLSKRTSFYATYAKVSNKNGAHYAINFSGVSGTFTTHGAGSGAIAGNGAATNRETGYVAGLVHRF